MVCSWFAIVAGDRFERFKNWRWRQSSANPSPNAYSLFSGKIQGISADSAPGTGSGSVFRTINQVVAAKFPTQKNREFSRENSECPQHIKELEPFELVGPRGLLRGSCENPSTDGIFGKDRWRRRGPCTCRPQRPSAEPALPPAARYPFRKCEKMVPVHTDGFSLPIAVPPKRNRKSPVPPVRGFFFVCAPGLEIHCAAQYIPAINQPGEPAFRGDHHV